MILTLTAASGVGKSTFLETLPRCTPCKVLPLTSTTTRAPRGDELPGEYEHISNEEFERLLGRGEFLELFEKYGNRYATRRARITEALFSENLYVPILVLPAVVVFITYAQKIGQRHRMFSVFLDLMDEKERERRLRTRGEEHPERRSAELAAWRKDAEHSGVPFLYLDASDSPEVLAKKAVERFKL